MEGDAGVTSTVFSTAKVNREDERAEVTSVKDVFEVPGRVCRSESDKESEANWMR